MTDNYDVDQFLRLGVAMRTDLTPRSRLLLLALAAGLPAACVAPDMPGNQFAGTWTTAERHQIAFRDNTVVVNPADAAPTPMAADSCAGTFHFSYEHKSREALLGLMPHQRDLRNRLATMLPRPDYAVAELTCGEGASTYVLLDDRDLVVVHRDRDIAGIERLSRL
jgi:hypothetical protein